MLSDLGRRVLGHLPVWAKNEKALIKAEGGAKESVRSYNLQQLTERLLEDPHTADMSEDQVLVCLEPLVEHGLAEVDKDGNYRMTQAGFDALHAPRDDAEEQVPGEVFLDLAPAQATATAEA
jgi:hypothetical protein